MAPRILLGNHPTLGMGGYVSKPGIDVTTAGKFGMMWSTVMEQLQIAQSGSTIVQEMEMLQFRGQVALSGLLWVFDRSFSSVAMSTRCFLSTPLTIQGGSGARFRQENRPPTTPAQLIVSSITL